MKKISDIAPEVLEKFRKGCVIPAQPLALDENRHFAPQYQRALCRYYIDSGVGGIAVGVHSTQFDIGIFNNKSQASNMTDQHTCPARFWQNTIHIQIF